MGSLNQIPTSRIEAFSDGVIAIIITVMVFDLKLQEIPTDKTVWSELLKLTPKFISYSISFFMLAIICRKGSVKKFGTSLSKKDHRNQCTYSSTHRVRLCKSEG
jgi:hypothetical protein